MIVSRCDTQIILRGLSSCCHHDDCTQLSLRALMAAFKLSCSGIFADLIQRLRSRERNRSTHRQKGRDVRRAAVPLSYNAPPFYMSSDIADSSQAGAGGSATAMAVTVAGQGGGAANESQPEARDSPISLYRRQVGERLYPKVRVLQPVSFPNMFMVCLSTERFFAFFLVLVPPVGGVYFVRMMLRCSVLLRVRKFSMGDVLSLCCCFWSIWKQ